MKQVKAKIYGRVQGVWFRESTKRKAEALGLKGWVRNESDSTVLLVAQGREQAIEDLIEWCHIGPELAKVDNVEVEEMEVDKEFDEFRVEW